MTRNDLADLVTELRELKGELCGLLSLMLELRLLLKAKLELLGERDVLHRFDELFARLNTTLNATELEQIARTAGIAPEGPKA